MYIYVIIYELNEARRLIINQSKGGMNWINPYIDFKINRLRCEGCKKKKEKEKKG